MSIKRFVTTVVSASNYLRARRVAAHRDLDRADLTAREFVRGAMQWQLAVLEQTESLAVPARSFPTGAEIGGRRDDKQQIGLERNGRWDRQLDISTFDWNDPEFIECVIGRQSFATKAIELPNSAIEVTDPGWADDEWDVDARELGLRPLGLLPA
ncbi:hypothetical protein [uncultured Jatrophihabitans sp.]|uniref:hypothetical protein n=1 Tax=uncultured Jatrophihabitans sp. TaxID=1610747 RepID=UPI0035CA1CED